MSNTPSVTKSPAEESPEFRDNFSLQHLKSVKSETAYYYNNRFIGKGGNGTAFLVTCSSGSNQGMQFVLKVFHKMSNPSRLLAFLKEIKHLKALNHPAIIRVFDEGKYLSFDKIEYPFVIIEYIPKTCRTLIATQALDRLSAIRIAMNCMSALNAIHTLSSPLIHRDIKPENILISDAGAKLADFGLIKVIDGTHADDDDVDPLTGTQWPGMPYRYRTPELVSRAINRKHPITTASDIYQFGTVLYEMLSGQNPQIQPDKVTDPIKLVTKPIIGSEGDKLSELVGLMLHDDPAKRPTAYQCLQKLNHIHRNLCTAITAVTGHHV
ncbi:serine/threonine protein kinase [Geothrix alkalitolerans]|uniref:serine/threonine protein kinase n=1 Tax=Geothrix alkalitolerans TaxID=2922724 RepID=UPI001FB01B82|nr:serine/threonine-protein kinase [Geothrix alkalitolerans]